MGSAVYGVGGLFATVGAVGVSRKSVGRALVGWLAGGVCEVSRSVAWYSYGVGLSSFGPVWQRRSVGGWFCRWEWTVCGGLVGRLSAAAVVLCGDRAEPTDAERLLRLACRVLRVACLVLVRQGPGGGGGGGGDGRGRLVVEEEK